MKRSEAECFVRRLYEGVLLREPDELGFQHHVAALVSGISPTAIVEAFVGCSEFKALHDVRLFVPPGHFYSPIVDVAEASSHLDRMASKDVPRALPGISISESELLTTWSDFLPFFSDQPVSRD